MRAVVCQNAELRVEDVPAPEPRPGQVRLRVVRCGICGSDLHARHGSDAWADMAARSGYRRFARSDQPIVYGHEFCGVVAEHGPGTRPEIAPGTLVVALPFLRNGGVVDPTGLSLHAPGAYAEEVLAEQSMTLAVPDGLDPEVAALTEPMAVALHAVRRAEVRRRDVAIVIGCGPIGLGVILMLKARGVRVVVAGDPSPGRRALAERCGADVVVDPAVGSPFAAAPRRGQVDDMVAAMSLALDTRERLGRLPVGWWHLWRLGEAVGAGPKRPVVFECVGAPGMIERIVDGAPLYSRVVVVGVCVGVDTFTPAAAINKEIDLRFVLAYTPLEFRDALRMLADGTVDPRPLITDTVGLDGVEGAFAELADPDRRAKILIDPQRP